MKNSGVYREPRCGSRYNVKISNWLLQSHVTILKQALCSFSRKLCGIYFNQLNNQIKDVIRLMKRRTIFADKWLFFSKHYRNRTISQFRCSLIFLFDIKKRANCPVKRMTDDDSILAKNTCDRTWWMENLWKRWVQVKNRDDPKLFGTSVDMIFARRFDLADQYLCQFIQGMFSVSQSSRIFFVFSSPPPTPPPISTLILM